MRSELVERIRRETPLHVRIKVDVEAHFIHKMGGSFFIPASEEGPEYEEIMRINGEAHEKAKSIVNTLLTRIKEWVDGNGSIDTLFEGIEEADDYKLQIGVLQELAQWQADGKPGEIELIKEEDDD